MTSELKRLQLVVCITSQLTSTLHGKLELQFPTHFCFFVQVHLCQMRISFLQQEVLSCAHRNQMPQVCHLSDKKAMPKTATIHFEEGCLVRPSTACQTLAKSLHRHQMAAE